MSEPRITPKLLGSTMKQIYKMLTAWCYVGEPQKQLFTLMLNMLLPPCVHFPDSTHRSCLKTAYYTPFRFINTHINRHLSSVHMHNNTLRLFAFIHKLTT